MADDALIEKVARAICRTHYENDGVPWEDLDAFVEHRWRHYIPEAEAAISAAKPAIQDPVYEERNMCVALIAGLALANGWKAGLKATNIEGWDPEWHGCVYIDLPTGQVSWHFHDSQAHLFAFLPPYDGEWDGHDTVEDGYLPKRLLRWWPAA